MLDDVVFYHWQLRTKRGFGTCLCIHYNIAYRRRCNTVSSIPGAKNFFVRKSSSSFLYLQFCLIFVCYCN